MPVIAFDVNETLLDLSVLDERFGSEALRRRWFAQMLQLAFVGGLTGRYVDFGTAQRAALEMLGTEVDPGVVDAMRSLPPHPDAAPALDRLRAAGLTLAALTNSTLDVARDQLRNAGLDHRFEAILSADQVKALKPRPEPYALVARTFGVGPADVRLVAAHSWDVTGALAAGCSAAFVARPGQPLSPLDPQPDIVGSDLEEVAAQILTRAGSAPPPSGRSPSA
jgi:2-haloacid dehalogenase